MQTILITAVAAAVLAQRVLPCCVRKPAFVCGVGYAWQSVPGTHLRSFGGAKHIAEAVRTSMLAVTIPHLPVILRFQALEMVVWSSGKTGQPLGKQMHSPVLETLGFSKKWPVRGTRNTAV